ncbi:MAG: nodulation protein S NodS [Methanobacteriota archaeon]|nr:MAG: nodulation protein S NodS [Euryarchaeota archaeon]PXY77358.1 MAG: nodulation protein S NodS [Euryarchaeota archaeon]HIB24053.1 class I SAM-dependent methyltransferase [Candidatus Poseidoniales archaeon]HIO57902.1 class I SAM-dependent methyltransferase [Candidatus Poseidoniales archaeon]
MDSTRLATDIFSEWAEQGRDIGMEKGHSASVSEMLESAIPHLPQPFSAIDIGCGNGWVVRKLATLGARRVEGVDGASEMIANARAIDPSGTYHEEKLPKWAPKNRFDLVHTMEFLYYLKNPQEMLTKIHDEWLEDGGWLVAGVDHYLEHEASLDWPNTLNVHMTTMSIDEWKTLMEKAGFRNIKIWQAAATDNFSGTLAMLGQHALDS